MKKIINNLLNMDSNSITFNEMSNNYALNGDNFNITPLLHKQNN